MAPRRKALIATTSTRVTRSQKENSNNAASLVSSQKTTKRSKPLSVTSSSNSERRVTQALDIPSDRVGNENEEKILVPSSPNSTGPIDDLRWHQPSSPQPPPDPATDPFGFFAVERILKFRREALTENRRHTPRQVDEEDSVDENDSDEEGLKAGLATPSSRQSSKSDSVQSNPRSPLQERTKIDNVKSNTAKKRKEHKITTMELEALLPRRRNRRGVAKVKNGDRLKKPTELSKAKRKTVNEDDEDQALNKPAEKRHDTEKINLDSESSSTKQARYRDLEDYKLETETVLWL